jgi:hypothetical protein
MRRKENRPNKKIQVGESLASSHLQRNIDSLAVTDQIQPHDELGPIVFSDM